MSAQAGILFADHRPITTEVFSCLSWRNSDRGSAPITTYAEHGLGMCHARLDCGRRVGAVQPLVLANGSVLTWDGRLDNRTDLILRLHRELKGDCSDVALVGSALTRWGAEALSTLVGDWALALWCPTDRAVLLARDCMGNRPLYYTAQPRCFAWSTCLETLVRWFQLYEQLSTDYMSRLLTYSLTKHRTPYRGVFSVPAGHFILSKGEVAPQLTRFWSWQPSRVRFRDPADYAAGLRETFRHSLECRMPTQSSVWAELSGGLDSSTIVCAANALTTMGGGPLRAVTYLFDHSPQHRELDHVHRVRDWCGVTSHKISIVHDDEWRVRHGGLWPFGPHAGLHQLMSLMSADGSSTLLSGELGDIVMAGDVTALLEPLARFELRAFAQDARLALDGGLLSTRALAHVLGSACLPTSLASRLQHRRALSSLRAAHRAASTRLSDIFAVTDECLSALPAIRERRSGDRDAFPPSKRQLVELYKAAAYGALSTPDELPSIRITYPFAHRPLLQYVLSIPHGVLWTPCSSRSLMRDAFSDLVEPGVLGRRDKGPPPVALSRSLVSELAGNPPTWRLVQCNYVHPGRLRHHLNGYMSGALQNQGYVSVLVATEMWLRQLQGRAAASAADSAP